MISGHNWKSLPESEEEVVSMLNAVGARCTHMGNVNTRELIYIISQLATVYTDLERYTLEAVDYLSTEPDVDPDMSIDWCARVRSALMHANFLMRPSNTPDWNILSQDENKVVCLLNELGIECDDLESANSWDLAFLINQLAIVYVDLETYSLEAISYFSARSERHQQMSTDWCARMKSALMHAGFLLQPAGLAS